MRKTIGRDYTSKQVERWAPDHMPAEWTEGISQKNPFVAEHEGMIVGFAELEPNGHIDRFYCHSDWQRKGDGKQLYQAIEEEACRMKIDLIFAEVSVTAREFFLSRGFEIVLEENNIICDAPAKRFQMQKRLK
jgi:N-acetylglutamate synthase-like GNAT family acetyltransferase